VIAFGPGRTTRYPSVAPAMGPLPVLDRRSVLARVTLVVCLLALCVLVRNTGGPGGGAEDGRVPPMPGAALVLPGVLRGGAPSDTELAQLHGSFDVRAVVAVGGASVEEQAVARDLGMRVLELDLAAGVSPAPGELRELVEFVRATTDVPGQAVYLHGATGAEPELVATSAMLLVLEDPTARVDVLGRLDPEGRAVLGPPHATAIAAVVAVAERRASPDNPYSPLEEVAR
jgi:hypothetical protein